MGEHAPFKASLSWIPLLFAIVSRGEGIGESVCYMMSEEQNLKTTEVTAPVQ